MENLSIGVMSVTGMVSYHLSLPGSGFRLNTHRTTLKYFSVLFEKKQLGEKEK
jgi:hypothetical protein